MSEIIETQPGKYHYKDCNGVESELEFAYLRGLSDDDFKCFKVNGKYGIIKNLKHIIADAVYSKIHCNWNRKTGDISSFDYTIDVIDDNGKEYKIYGVILTDGSVIQDVDLHYKSDYHKEYTLRIPQNYIFICHIVGGYYLYKDKYDNFGMLKYDKTLKPCIIRGFNSYGLYNGFKSFSLRDKYSRCICFFKERNINIGETIKTRECEWFVYSVVCNEGKFVEKLNNANNVWETKKYFWWYKQEKNYGLLDPYLKVIIPPIYEIDPYNLVVCKV